VVGLDSDWLEGCSVRNDLDVGVLCLSYLLGRFVVLMGSKSEG